MRTWDLLTDDGRIFGFEIENLTISRGGVVRTIRRIPGALITKGDKYLDRRHDDFCHFTFEGEAFIAEELFGDNSRFWIYAEAESGFHQVALIKRAFEQRKLFAVS